MPFASDAQRKWWFANNGESSGGASGGSGGDLSFSDLSDSQVSELRDSYVAMKAGAELHDSFAEISANNQTSSVDVDYHSQAYERANNAIKNREYGQGHFFETEAEAVSSRDDSGSWLADNGVNRSMPQTSEAEKIDWAAWRGDFGKK